MLRDLKASVELRKMNDGTFRRRRTTNTRTHEGRRRLREGMVRVEQVKFAVQLVSFHSFFIIFLKPEISLTG